MENEEKFPLEGFTLKMLLTAVFEWAYDNDADLYKNLDGSFDAFQCRSGISDEQRSQMRLKKIFETRTASELLEKALENADYHDALKFSWTFAIDNNSTNKAHASHGWKYSSMKPHPYSHLLPLIQKRMDELKRQGMADWHRSADHEKHSHFRYWIEHQFLSEEKLRHLRLFVVNTGNVRAFETIYMGSSNEQSYQEIMRYVLEKNICPDPHYKKIEVPDFVNPDPYNPREIKSSGRFGGFWYLAYLTGSELKEIYKTKINKKKLNYAEKPNWAFINASGEDKETKFFLFVS